MKSLTEIHDWIKEIKNNESLSSYDISSGRGKQAG